TIYSDISMVMLDAMIEAVTGERIDQFVTRNIFMPLEMRDTRYTPLRPVDASPFELDRIAPTLKVGSGHIQGTPQDPTARALDGISGNAGLFSSVRDVARYAQLMLVGAEGMRTPLLSDSVIQLFTTRAPGATRALGWDGPGASTTWGPYFSDASFGHTGYTGTSIWIDPARDVFVVLLTNRVDPSAANEKHLALRRAVNALVEDHFAGTPPSRLDALTAGAASLLEGLPSLVAGSAEPPRDTAAPLPQWLLPGEGSLAPHAGAGLTLLLLFLLPTAMALAHDPALRRRAQALSGRVRTAARRR
ncbi:MAG TPA: serine hydrolase, partial [Longimicrobiales bacterium]